MFSTQSSHVITQLLLHLHLINKFRDKFQWVRSVFYSAKLAINVPFSLKWWVCSISACIYGPVFMLSCVCLLHVFDICSASASSHPHGVYSSRCIVPGDRQRKQRAPQFSVDAVVKDVLVGVVVRKRNTARINRERYKYRERTEVIKVNFKDT